MDSWQRVVTPRSEARDARSFNPNAEPELAAEFGDMVPRDV